MASDYDFFAKLIVKKKVKFKYIPIPFSSFRIHNKTLSSKHKNINKKEVMLIRKKYMYMV